jgi:hypothetical protein
MDDRRAVEDAVLDELDRQGQKTGNMLPHFKALLDRAAGKPISLPAPPQGTGPDVPIGIPLSPPMTHICKGARIVLNHPGIACEDA